MENLSSLLKKRMGNAIQKAFAKRLSPDESIADIAPCTQKEFGHYQCNSALPLAKILKENPRSVAEKIIKEIPSKEIFEKIEIAGPGFINLTLSPKFLSNELKEALADKHLGVSVPEKKKK